MKEKDLDKNLENIIIDGLIKEAEQDSADFAAVMCKLSDVDFDAIVREPAYADDFCEAYLDRQSSGMFMRNIVSSESDADRCLYSTMVEDKESTEQKSEIRESRFKIFRPWIAAAVSAAAIILIVLIPSINSMNAKLCDSALFMSEAYITAPKGGFDISSATIDQIKEELPNLEHQYQCTIEQDGKYVHYHDGFQEAGWTLTIAYLKLHKKSDAVKVLKTLETQTHGTPFGNHCAKMLEQLD